MSSYSIVYDEQGLSVKKQGQLRPEHVGIAWVDVQKASAFKRDLFTVDRVCIFFSRFDGTGIEVNEDMNGWPSLLKALPYYLPGSASASEWLPAVSMPAFEENETMIYERQS